LSLAQSTLPGAVGAAEKLPLALYAMTDNSAPAVIARRSNRVNRALETVERVAVAGRYNFKGLVVVVAADFALCHHDLLCPVMTQQAPF
jgi:hypothetical protein